MQAAATSVTTACCSPQNDEESIQVLFGCKRFFKFFFVRGFFDFLESIIFVIRDEHPIRHLTVQIGCSGEPGIAESVGLFRHGDGNFF